MTVAHLWMSWVVCPLRHVNRGAIREVEEAAEGIRVQLMNLDSLPGCRDPALNTMRHPHCSIGKTGKLHVFLVQGFMRCC
jgi:hypothetical protein